MGNLTRLEFGGLEVLAYCVRIIGHNVLLVSRPLAAKQVPKRVLIHHLRKRFSSSASYCGGVRLTEHM